MIISKTTLLHIDLSISVDIVNGENKEVYMSDSDIVLMQSLNNSIINYGSDITSQIEYVSGQSLSIKVKNTKNNSYVILRNLGVECKLDEKITKDFKFNINVDLDKLSLEPDTKIILDTDNNNNVVRAIKNDMEVPIMGVGSIISSFGLGYK